MSTGPLGSVGASLAGTSLAQTKGSEIERSQHDVARHERRTETNARAESAAGIGETDENQQTGERDADGRRLWEAPADKKREAPTPPPQAKDPTGQSGGLLDISG